MVFIWKIKKDSNNYILSATQCKHPAVNSSQIDTNTEEKFQNVNIYYRGEGHVEFEHDHLNKLDEIILIDNMCLKISDINFLSSFIMRNEKSEVSHYCLIVPVTVGSVVEKVVDTIF